MKRYLSIQHAAGAAIFLLACGISAAELGTAMQFSQQPDQSQQQGQQGQPPFKDKDKDKQQKKKGPGNPQDNAQGNAQDNTQPANPGGNANPPAGSGAQPSDKPTGGGKPAPLFGGSLNLKSSRQTKDTATMGFNGVDPNGQVQKSFLTAAATNADRSKAQQVAAYKVDAQELAQFIQDAELNPNAAAPPQKSK